MNEAESVIQNVALGFKLKKKKEPYILECRVSKQIFPSNPLDAALIGKNAQKFSPNMLLWKYGNGQVVAISILKP